MVMIMNMIMRGAEKTNMVMIMNMIMFMIMIMNIFDDAPQRECGAEIMNMIMNMIMHMIMMAQSGARRGPVRRRHGDQWRVKSYNNQI